MPSAEAIARLRPSGLRYRGDRRHGPWRRHLSRSTQDEGRSAPPSVARQPGAHCRSSSAGESVGARSLAVDHGTRTCTSPAPSALLSWIRDNEPERYARIAHFLERKGLAALLPLTGTIGTDRTEASTLLHRCPHAGLCQDALRLFGLDRLAGRAAADGRLRPRSSAG